MERIDIHTITHPLHALPIHHRHQATQRLQRTGRRMISRDPLRIQQHHLLGPRLHRDLLMGMLHAVNVVAQVHRKRDRPHIRLVHRRGDRWRHGNRLRLCLRLGLRQSSARHGTRDGQGEKKTGTLHIATSVATPPSQGAGERIRMLTPSPAKQTTRHKAYSSPGAGSSPERHPSTSTRHAHPTLASPLRSLAAPSPALRHLPFAWPHPWHGALASTPRSIAVSLRRTTPDSSSATNAPAPRSTAHPESSGSPSPLRWQTPPRSILPPVLPCPAKLRQSHDTPSSPRV